MYQIQTHFELGCELNNHIGIDNYICHVFQSEEEAYEVAYTMIKAAFTEGRKSIFFSPIFKGGRQDSSYFKAMASQGQLIIQDIKLFNLLNDIKNYLANSQLCQGDETPYLLLDLSQVDHSAFSQLSLFEQLTTLNGYLHTHYKTSLLLQVNADYLPPIKQQMLITMYPTYVINGKVRNNHLYKAPTFPENQVKVQNSQGVINIHRLDLPAYETDTSGEIVYCSPSFAELLGYKVEEIISKDEIDLVAGRKDLFPVMNTRKYKLPDSSLDLYYFQTAYFRADGSSIIADEIICSIQVKEQDYTNYHLLRFSEGDPDSYYMLMHNKKFHRLFNTGNAALIMLEPLQSGDGCIYDAQITELSQSLPGLINTSGRSLSDHTITDLNCQQVDLWLRAINSVVESGGQAYFETYEAVNDKYLDVMVFNPVSGPMIALVSDVSQVKRIEERFQKQIVFLENILDGIPTPVFYRDTCGRFQFANKAFAIAIGLDRRDILGQSLFKVLPEDLASKYRAMDLDLLTNAGIQTYEWEFQHANGNRYDVIFNKAPLSNSEEEFIGVVGTFIDITQRKEAQEALRLSEEKFRGIFRQSPIGIAVYNPKGQLIDVNMAMTNILGIDSIEDVRHFNLFADRHFKHGDEHILNKMAILSYEEELDFDKIRSVNAYKTNKTGKSFIKYFISPLRYPDGSIEGFLVQIQDITEQKIAAEALQASEANLRRLTDNMIDMIGQVNIAGDYEYITPSCHSILGYEVEEMLGRSFYEFVHAQDLDKVKEHFTSAFRSKTFSKFDYRYLCKDGSYIYVETVVNIIFDKKGRIYGAVLVSRDISDRKRMESELSRLDRLKTVGEMAAGLGHEIRNPMTTVRGFLQMLGDNPEFQDYQEVFSLMIEELDDANSIITEFLSLAKDKPLYSEQGNLNDILMAIYPLISADAIKSDKEVKMELKNIPDLMLDSKEIRQLIFNMTRNGLESMQPGQVLTIKTYQKDDMVVLQIQDQGCGIQDEILENLGTPFYTTKDMGVGLGLPICFNIAARHNARIDVNTSSQGTTFWINFRL